MDADPRIAEAQQKLQELRDAGGDGWDDIDDPQAFLASGMTRVEWLCKTIRDLSARCEAQAEREAALLKSYSLAVGGHNGLMLTAEAMFEAAVKREGELDTLRARVKVLEDGPSEADLQMFIRKCLRIGESCEREKSSGPHAYNDYFHRSGTMLTEEARNLLAPKPEAKPEEGR